MVVSTEASPTRGLPHLEDPQSKANQTTKQTTNKQNQWGGWWVPLGSADDVALVEPQLAGRVEPTVVHRVVVTLREQIDLPVRPVARCGGGGGRAGSERKATYGRETSHPSLRRGAAWWDGSPPPRERACATQSPHVRCNAARALWRGREWRVRTVRVL
jgi:hypothetical protein